MTLPVTAPLTLAAAAQSAGSPWHGAWTVDLTRSSAQAKHAAAGGYRFDITPHGQIRWDNPTLHEVVTSQADRSPDAGELVHVRH